MLKWNIKIVKKPKNYPKETDKHNKRWNRLVVDSL